MDFLDFYKVLAKLSAWPSSIIFLYSKNHPNHCPGQQHTLLTESTYVVVLKTVITFKKQFPSTHTYHKVSKLQNLEEKVKS